MNPENTPSVSGGKIWTPNPTFYPLLSSSAKVSWREKLSYAIDDIDIPSIIVGICSAGTIIAVATTTIIALASL